MKKIIIVMAIFFVLILGIVRADDVAMNISVNGTANFDINVSTEDTALRQDVYGAGNTNTQDSLLSGADNQTNGSVSAICSNPALQQYFSQLSALPPAEFKEQLKALGYGDEAHLDTIWAMCEQVYVSQQQGQWSQDNIGLIYNNWDVAMVINEAIDNLQGNNDTSTESKIIANSLGSYFASHAEVNKSYSALAARVAQLELRTLTLEKAIEKTDPASFCEAKKDVMTQLGLVFVKCDDGVYWNTGQEIAMSDPVPVNVKVYTFDNSPRVTLQNFTIFDLEGREAKKVVAVLSNIGTGTRVATVSLDIPSNKTITPNNKTITLSPGDSETVVFTILRNAGESCGTDSDCRIGVCLENVCKPRVTFKAPATVVGGKEITVQMLSEDGSPMAKESFIVSSGEGSITLTTDSDGNASFVGMGGDVYDYKTNDYLLTGFASTNVLMPENPKPAVAPVIIPVEASQQVSLAKFVEQSQLASIAMVLQRQLPLVIGMLFMAMLVFTFYLTVVNKESE